MVSEIDSYLVQTCIVPHKMLQLATKTLPYLHFDTFGKEYPILYIGIKAQTAKLILLAMRIGAFIKQWLPLSKKEKHKSAKIIAFWSRIHTAGLL